MRDDEWVDTQTRVRLIALAVGLYLLMCAAVFVAVRRANGGHFVFGLDDPYIHLALAQQIAHGHYGINATEASSPSSSLLWPLLLAPFAVTRFAVMATLLLNVVCGVGAAWLIGAMVAAWPGGGRDERVRRELSVVALLFIANAVGLTFIGMEHMLQTMLALACAWGIVACLRGMRVPVWCVVAAVVGPWVRYESLGITLALCVALWGQRRRRGAALVMTTAVVPLVGFSIFLRGLGLPMLPTSVMVKGGAATAGHGYLVAFAKDWAIQMAHAFGEPEKAPLLVLFATLVGLAWVQTERVRRFALGGAAAAAGLHLLIGRYGWSYRYEVYVLAFAAVVTLYVVHERPRMLLGWYALGLLACSMPYVRAAMETHRASHDVYRQQYQTARLTRDFYKGNIAVDDLGLVSFDRPRGQYVLDLFGLGSVEAAREKDKSAAWLDGITRRHEVGLVAIYPYYKELPKSWRPLGKLCLTGPTPIVAERCVAYYATGLAAEPETERAFAAFVRTLPEDVAASEIAAGDRPLGR
jgi:hypothetical protein